MPSSKPPLKNLQIAVHDDHSRRYLVLDACSSPSPPSYPFKLDPDAATLNYSWNGSLDGPLRSARSLAPPISPPALSPRSDRSFAREHVSTDSNATQDSHPPRADGLPEDMQDLLRQLDDLASWVKAVSSSSDCNVTSIARVPRHTEADPIPDKGKSRLFLTSPSSGYDIRRDLVDPSSPTVSGNSAERFPSSNRRSEGFIYAPNRNTPEFLEGSSSSPIAYPVCGYSSHPSQCSPHLSASTHDIPCLERRSAPYHPPTSPLISPPSGRVAFKTLFQRSRTSTNAVSRQGIPPDHVPVENASRRMRFPWLRI